MSPSKKLNEQKPHKMYPVCYSFFGTLFSKGQLSAELTQVAPEPKPLSLAEEDLLADLTYDELKRAFRCSLSILYV